MQEEIWIPLKFRTSFYRISNFGRVKSLDRYSKVSNLLIKGVMIKTSINKKGYEILRIHADGKQKTIKMHRAVAMHFHPNPENKPEVNHKDFNKLNNRADNLEWATQEENMDHAWENGRVPHVKLKKPDIVFIRENYAVHGPQKLSEMFNCSKSTIYNIATNKSRNFDKSTIVKQKVFRVAPAWTKKITHLGSGEVYNSAEELSTISGIPVKEIQRRLNGERKNNLPYAYLEDMIITNKK